MARTAITPIVPPGKYPVLPLTALSAAFAFTAADNVNGNQAPSTGREILLVRNTDAAPQTVTVSSSPDPLNRSGDITTYSLPIGSVTPQFAVLGPFPISGWKQPDGNLYFTASAATIAFAVIQLPAGSAI
jgi:hypothetical protein